MRLLDEDRPTDVSEQDRVEMQSHLPYAGLQLNELSVQEERLVLFHLRGMSKAAAGRAAGYKDMDRVYQIFKTPKMQTALTYFRNEMREEIKFDKNTATGMYLEAHSKAANSTEEKNVVDSLCKLHGLHIPEQATLININVEKVEQLEKLSDSDLLKLSGESLTYLEPDGHSED